MPIQKVRVCVRTRITRCAEQRGWLLPAPTAAATAAARRRSPADAHPSLISQVSGDPRRPAEVRKYNRPKVNLEEQPPDMFLLMALALGLVSLVFKAKLPAWGSLQLSLCAIANTKSGHSDLKQVITSLTFAVFGLVSAYMVPLRQRGGGGGGGGGEAAAA